MICACSGSRPQNFPWNYHSGIYALYRAELRRRLQDLIDRGAEEFVVGMARGADTDIAEEVIALKDEGVKVRLYCVIPYSGQADGLSAAERARYDYILSRADGSETLFPIFRRDCFHAHNRRMVYMSDMLFAVWNGKQTGGTASTVRYAVKQGKPHELFDLRDFLWSE